MADPEVVVGTQTPLADETMNAGEDDGEQDPTGLEDIEPTISERTGFIECVTIEPRVH
jgi:hypothetical protein